MLSALIAMIMAIFAFLGAVAGDTALPALQNAQDEAIAAISEVMTQDEDTNGDNGENGNGDENGDDENGNGDEPENNKVRAYNTAAGFVLPAMVAQIAVDNSPVLIGCDEVGADCEDTSPGNSDHAQNGNNGNGENGSDNADNGNIGLAKADEAKSNRP